MWISLSDGAQKDLGNSLFKPVDEETFSVILWDFMGLAPAGVAEAGSAFPILTQKVFFNVCIIGNKISIKYVIELKHLR